jgi:hypothetical protein
MEIPTYGGIFQFSSILSGIKLGIAGADPWLETYAKVNLIPFHPPSTRVRRNGILFRSPHFLFILVYSLFLARSYMLLVSHDSYSEHGRVEDHHPASVPRRTHSCTR